MILAWMLYATALAALFGIAASLLENGLTAMRVPTRWVWASALVASVAIPAAALVVPNTTTISTLTRATPDASTILGAVELAPVIGFDIFRALDPINVPLTALWLTMSALIFATLAWTSWRTRRHATAWQRSRVGNVDVCYSASSGPAVVGCFPGTIVLPRWTRQLCADWQSMMVMHEEEHVRAWDTTLIAAGLVMTALVPWNAFVWWQFKRLRHAVELDCDARVLKRGVNRHAYGELLIELTQRGQRQLIPAVGLATRKPLLSRRISVMMNQTTRKIGLRAVTATSAAAVLIIIGCSMPTPPDEDISVLAGATRETPVDPTLKAQIAEARVMMQATERALKEHVAEEAVTPLSETARTRRAELIGAVQEATEHYELLMQSAGAARHLGDDDTGGVYKFRVPSADDDLHFGPDGEARHTVKPIVYVDGVQQGGEFSIANVDDIFNGPLTRDQIERVEVLRGAAKAEMYGGPETPVIQITTKAHAGTLTKRN